MYLKYASFESELTQIQKFVSDLFPKIINIILSMNAIEKAIM